MKRILSCTFAFALLASGLCTAPVLAQDEGADDDVLDMIVVTARKREQSIQDTPIAISAFDAQELKAAAFDNIVDVSKAAPGLFIEPLNSTNARVDAQPRFRGVTFESQSPLQRTGSIFIDGILVSGGIQSIGVQELERVEIIKGPQSALFGRNTFSGAINYVTRRPGDEFQAETSVSWATRNEYTAYGSIEGPLAGEQLTGRLSASLFNKDGHYDNQNVDGQRLGDERTFSVSGSLVYQPNDRFSIRMRGNAYQDDDGPAAIIKSAGFTEHNFGGFDDGMGGTTETAYRGTVRIPSGDEVGLDTSRETFDSTMALALNDPRGVGIIDLDFGDLGGAGLVREGFRMAMELSYDWDNGTRLEYLQGINEDEWLGYFDFDSSPGLGFNTTGGREVRDESMEVRLSGSAMDDRLDWSIGANRIDVEIRGTGGFYDGFGFWFSGVFGDPTRTAAKTIGYFGSLDYKVTDQFTLIFEGRAQEDEIFEDAVNAGLATPISPTTFDSFLPRILFQYDLNEDTMLYFNYSLGNLPGGFNVEVGELDAMQLAEFESLAPGIGTSFDEEELENFEFGLKRTAQNGRLAYNIAAFLMERTDQIYSGFEVVADPTEVNGQRTVAFTANGASTDITGLEIEGTWLATDSLTLQGSLAWVNAEIASFPEGANSGDFTAVFGPDANVKGQQAPRYPEWAGHLSGTYERPLSSGDGDWYTRADLYYTGTFYDENTNLAELPSAVDLNLRTGLRINNTTFEVFVTNLLGEDAPAAGNNIADTSLAVRFGSAPYDFTQESVHVQLRDKTQVGFRFEQRFQ